MEDNKKVENSEPSEGEGEGESLHSEHEGEEDTETEPVQETDHDLHNQSVELDNAHGGADMDASDGYAQVNDTQTEEEAKYNMGDNIVHKLSNEMDSQSIELSKIPQNPSPAQSQPATNAPQNYDPKNVINVVQSCTEGQFKPLLA